MKNKLFSLLFAGIMGVLAVHAQTDYAKLGIERKVLFTMNKNEICTSVKTRNLQKGASYAKSEMYVVDTIKKITTYVLNGERIKAANLDVEYFEGSTYNDCMERDSLILQYDKYSENEPSAYVSFGDKIFGPYTWTTFGWYGFQLEWEEFFYGGEYGDFLDLYKHDHDGMEYKMLHGEQGRTYFQSPNRKHTVNMIGNNIYKVRLDNISYTLDSIKPDRSDYPYYGNGLEKNVTADVKVYDDGNCVIRYGLFFSDEIDGLCFETCGGYYIDKGKVRTIAKNQYFDFESRTIKENQKKKDPYTYRIAQYEREYVVGDDEDGRTKYAEDTPEENAKIVENILKDHRLGYHIWDEKHQHQFFTVQGMGYILIDGVAIKSNYPILASRNTIVNAFRWVVVEGNEVVYYSYQIP